MPLREQEQQRSLREAEQETFAHVAAQLDTLYRQIAARYAAERLLRGRIDTYIKLFERLLDSMSAAPKSESMVKACLESEAGHIYMMLTDVTGRRPPQ